MKLITTLLLSACTIVAFAQNKTKQSLHQDINDNGKTLTINISGNSDGKAIKYHKQFDVTGMSQQARQTIVNRITDSLGVSRTTQTQVLPSVPAHSKSKSVTSSVHTSVEEHGDTMSLNIVGTRNNVPLNYYHTFKVKGMSKQRKDALVQNITDSLGIGNSTH